MYMHATEIHALGDMPDATRRHGKARVGTKTTVTPKERVTQRGGGAADEPSVCHPSHSLI